MCRICWGVVAVLLVVISGVVYKFIFQGEVINLPDERIAIQLNKEERALVLSEMRVFLESVQGITKGISNDDMDLVVKSARQSGNNAQIAVPGTLVGKLPLGFKKLGFSTHAKFDELALDAEQLGDGSHSLSQMSSLLENCVACHSAYKFELEPLGLNN